MRQSLSGYERATEEARPAGAEADRADGGGSSTSPPLQPPAARGVRSARGHGERARHIRPAAPARSGHSSRRLFALATGPLPAAHHPSGRIPYHRDGGLPDHRLWEQEAEEKRRHEPSGDYPPADEQQLVGRL